MPEPGLCRCGCGQRTNLAPQTDARKGWRKGEPMRYVAGHQRRVAFESRLLTNTDMSAGPDACWPWLGTMGSAGYGQMWDRECGGQVGAHRASYEHYVGPIPAGLQLDHLCRNRACVNPAHLEPVTVRENLLRGDTMAARNAAKTHCPNGHRYDVVNRAGSRCCRTCNREEARRRYWAQKVAA